MIIGIQDEILNIHALGFLGSLLADKTTKRHILWATDAYKDLGSAYQRDSEITTDLITGKHSYVIKNRSRKELEQQSRRTRQHAEVFTPMKICNQMNNYADEIWFGQSDLFNIDGKPTTRIEFPEGKRWQYYVDSKRLEITCGEAPYLVSRYDVMNGEAIPLEYRIGILDRKLRVVTENTDSEEDWLFWAFRAFEATYGYEFQGDSLLIARVNLFMTFEEYLAARWHRKPTYQEYQRIVKIITWNIWQMDGLTGTIPYGKAKNDNCQMELSDYSEEFGTSKQLQPPCRIHDWRSKCTLTYLSMLEKIV